MHVCHVVECGGGVGNVIVDLVQAGLEAGDDVTVVYGAARAWPHFLQALTGMKKVHLVASTLRRAVGFHDFVDTIRLYAILRRHGPFDVIQAHSSKAGALVRLLRPFLRRSVVIYTPHAIITLAPETSRIYVWIERLLSYFCDAMVCLSREEKDHVLRSLKIPEHKLHVIPNGIDLHYPYDRATARAQIGARDTDYIVGFIGRLEAQKNPLRAVEAFAEAAKQRSNLRLAMVGQGPWQAQTEQAIGAHGLTDRVSFLPSFNGRSLVAGFDCLLCSSDYEGFGLVILEALAAGVPVVMTPVGSSEAVTTGLTGTVAPDFSPAALAAGILKFVDNDAAECARISAAAKAGAQKFSRERMTIATRALYTDLLSHR